MSAGWTTLGLETAGGRRHVLGDHRTAHAPLAGAGLVRLEGDAAHDRHQLTLSALREQVRSAFREREDVDPLRELSPGLRRHGRRSQVDGDARRHQRRRAGAFDDTGIP